ncbi:MAG: MFS transporter [Oscillospiraceae bacterium]|nr:MFS transporter [Oscillospiraceae bacterium]
MENSYISRTSGIGAKDKIGYAMGDVASLLVFGLVQSVLQKYYTDVLGIGVVSIMLMFIVARVWDAINDPIWGRIVDSIPAAADGRYRRWMKSLAVPVALSAVLMFVKIPGLSERGYLIYAYVTYILFGMLYTGINIPYGSMAQVITSDERERSSLSVFRSMGSTFGAFPAMVLISFCYVKLEDGRSVMSYSKILSGVILISVLSVLAYLLCYRWTTERVPTQPVKGEKGQTMKVLSILLKSRPFMAICLVGMLFLAAQMFSQSYYTYLFNYYFNAPQLSMLPTVCQYLPVGIIMLFAGRLGAKFGRRELCAYGMLAAGLCNLVLYMMGTANVWIFLGVCLISGIGNAFIFLLVWAIAADAIDYNEVNYGLHDEATSYAFFTFMRKLGQTIAAILVNVALLRIGYTDNVLNTANITGDTLSSMYAYSVLVPAVLYVLIFFILRWMYPLGKKEIDALRVKKEEALRKLSEGK